MCSYECKLIFSYVVLPVEGMSADRVMPWCYTFGDCCVNVRSDSGNNGPGEWFSVLADSCGFIHVVIFMAFV